LKQVIALTSSNMSAS